MPSESYASASRAKKLLYLLALPILSLVMAFLVVCILLASTGAKNLALGSVVLIPIWLVIMAATLWIRRSTRSILLLAGLDLVLGVVLRWTR